MNKTLLYITIGFIIIITSYWTIKSIIKNKTTMQVTVWDTYVNKKNGAVMHFDIVAPESVTDTSVIHNYGLSYLKGKGQEGQPLTAKECRRCHVRDIKPEWEEDINKQGFFIIEMENCNE